MVASMTWLGQVALLLTLGAGFRNSRRSESPKTKFIGGVPVVNYEKRLNVEVLGETSSEDADWIVFVKVGTPDSELQDMCKLNRNGCNFFGHPTGGAPLMKMRGTEKDLEAVLLASGGTADYVELDGEVLLIPDIDEDAEAPSVWALNRIGADARSNRGEGVTVYVQDTGIRYTHTEFGGRASSSVESSSVETITGSVVECNGDLSCALDVRGHGTHCAGSAAGATYGVAPAAFVRAVKSLGDQGTGQRSHQYMAMDWVAVNGKRPAIISASYAGQGADPGYSTVIDAAVEAGVVVVVAAGNSNSDACEASPAFVASAITVGSTTSLDAKSWFSSFGSCTNIWAPGSDIVSAGVECDDCTETKSGTSMACPHVSGAAALILSADPNKKAPAVLQQLADDAFLNILTGLKFADTNALLCVAEGGAPPTPTPQPTPAPAPGNWVVEGAGCEEDGNCVQSFRHPFRYGNNQECLIKIYGFVRINVEAFDTHSSDVLTIGGKQYSGTQGPPGGKYSGNITWVADAAWASTGWRMCKFAGGALPAPTPQPPTPAPAPGNWVVEGAGCEEDGSCVQSFRHPSRYDNNQECLIKIYGEVRINVEAFDTDSSDVLTIGGQRYSGTQGPPGGKYSGNITWVTDAAGTSTGWRMCKSRRWWFR